MRRHHERMHQILQSSSRSRVAFTTNDRGRERAFPLDSSEKSVARGERHSWPVCGVHRAQDWSRGFPQRATGATMKSFNKYGFVLLIVFAGAASAQTLDQRKAAAEATAQSTTNYCGQIPPADPLNGIGAFYWEISDAADALPPLDHGTIPTSYPHPIASDGMSIARLRSGSTRRMWRSDGDQRRSRRATSISLR